MVAYILAGINAGITVAILLSIRSHRKKREKYYRSIMEHVRCLVDIGSKPARKSLVNLKAYRLNLYKIKIEMSKSILFDEADRDFMDSMCNMILDIIQTKEPNYGNRADGQSGKIGGVLPVLQSGQGECASGGSDAKSDQAES